MNDNHTISSTEYARKCRAFLELLKDLDNLGYALLAYAYQFYAKFSPAQPTTLICLV